MSFQRTPSGLSNLHLFYGVDAIVFVEGGASYSVIEIVQGRYNPHSHDIKFWSTLFSRFRGDLQCHFRAVGSKASLLALIKHIAENKVNGVFVCLDRDLDHLLGNRRLASGVLRTRGYSWENCVWTENVVLQVFQKFNTSGPDITAAQEEIDAAFREASAALRWFVYAYSMLVVAGCSDLEIEKTLGALGKKSAVPPRIDRGYLLRFIRSGHSAVGKVKLKSRIKIDILLDCYGHLVGRFGYQLLAYLLRKYCGIHTFPIDVATPVAIDEFVRTLPTDHKHYSDQMAALLH